MILAVYRDNARLSDSLSACNFLGYKGSFKSVLPVLISILPDLTDYTLFLLSAHPPSTTKAHKEVLFISAMRLAVVHLIVSPPRIHPTVTVLPKCLSISQTCMTSQEGLLRLSISPVDPTETYGRAPTH